jgi:hypothetical protein
MALSLQLGYPSVPKSITNKNVSNHDALDNTTPISFLTFIKIINVSFEPDSLQDYYNFYLTEWNNLNKTSTQTDIAIITDKYREFLRELSLKHTTLEEKHFLSKIDFNDPYDLDVVMGFYGRKLKELSIEYNNKRNDIKFNVVRSKLIGTTFGSEKTILEIVLSFLKTFDDGELIFDYDQIVKDLEIEIDELYDIYPSYFNQLPDVNVYDNKDLDYGYNIFLTPDSITISTLLSGFSNELQELKEFDDLLDNKRKLTQKYISTDFYYLSTGNTTSNFLSGKLFSSNNNILNFTNRNYPTTASTQRVDYLKDSRSIGFFRPHKQSIILVDGDNYSYSFNLEHLEPNSLYFFPDPSKIGKNGSVLTFIVDDSRLKRNYSSGSISNQPYSNPNDVKTYGYISKIEPFESKYLDSVFDKGYISDIKTDIYGNLFGLFKDDHRFRQTIRASNEFIPPAPYSLVINGHMFYDTTYWEGYNFNYVISDDTYPSDIKYNETIRTGLSTTTTPFISSNIDLTLFFGYFSPYAELSLPTESNLITEYEILDGAYLTNYDLRLYNDSISSDLSAFDKSFTLGLSSFYYDTLVDAGIYSSDPLQRALLDPLYPSISANLTKTTKTSALEIVDGGYIGTYFPPLKYTSPDYIYIDSLYSPSQYAISSFPIIDGYELNGKLMIKNTANKSVNTLLNTLPYINTKYSSNILDELQNNILKFDISNDILFIETPSYLTINKLVYLNGEFTDPKKISYSIEHSTNNFDKISNTFKSVFDVYYYKLVIYESISDNNFVIYPEIYKFDIINCINNKIFPKTSSDITNNLSFFTISGGNVRYVSSASPTLTYSSRNNIFNASFLLKDQNDMFVLHEIDFTINNTVEFLSHVAKSPSINNMSNIFSSLNTVNVFLSSNYYIVDETLVI